MVIDGATNLLSWTSTVDAPALDDDGHANSTMSAIP
jgi:hypothetical protein